MEDSEVMTASTHLSQYRLMAQYNSCVNRQIYNLVAALTETEWQCSLGSFFESIHSMLSHILVGD